MKSKKSILISAFEPFAGDSTNITEQVTRLIPDRIEDCEIHKIVLPVVYGKCSLLLIDKVRQTSPLAVLSFGQATSRNLITPERYAKNVRRARIPDNEGNIFSGEKIEGSGPDVLESTLDLKMLERALLSANTVGASISHDAGEYVCNDLMYGMLYALKKEKENIKYAFVHLPTAPLQTLKDPLIAMLREVALSFKQN